MGTFPFEQAARSSRSVLASLCRRLGACAIYSRCFQARLAICFRVLNDTFSRPAPLCPSLVPGVASVWVSELGRGKERSCSRQGSTVPETSQGRKETPLPASERSLWSPWLLGSRTARSLFFFQRTGEARKDLERIAGDPPQLPHRPRRFCRDQVPASVAATESLHGGRARPCPATRSCFPATSSLSTPAGTCDSLGSRSPASRVAVTAPSTLRATRGRPSDPPGHPGSAAVLRGCREVQ